MDHKGMDANVFFQLGPHHTSNFHEQYCHREIKRHYHKEIKRHFSCNNFFHSSQQKHACLFPKNIFKSDKEKKDGMKNYGFIAISFYGNMF
jgi:hypothetical protein